MLQRQGTAEALATDGSARMKRKDYEREYDDRIGLKGRHFVAERY